MIRVCRQGRLYGAPSRVYLHWTGSELRHGTFDDLFGDVAQAAAEANRDTAARF